MNAAGNLRLAVVFEVENGELKSRLVDSQKAIDALGQAGREAANDMDRAGAATDRLGRELAGTEQAMGRTRAESQRTARAMTEQARATDLAQRSTDSTTAALGSMRTALAGVGLALGVREVIQYADGWTLANNRLRLVTDSAGDLVAIQSRLFDVSQQTRSSFEATVALYSRMYQATRDLDTSSEDLVEVVTAIQQAFRVSGASAQEAENAVIQLAQGLASGTLRGDEFNSVMEQAPRLATAMTTHLNVTRGELREMAADGKISAETIIAALKAQSDAIAAEYATVQATIGDSLTVASNALQQWIGQTDEANGTSRQLARTIVLAAENMDLLATASIAGVGALAAVNAAGRMTALIGGIRGATTAMGVFNAVSRANPVLLLASAAGAAVAAFITLGDEGARTSGTMRELGEAIGLTTDELEGGEKAIDAYVKRLREINPAQLKAAQDAAQANITQLTTELQQQMRELLGDVRQNAPISLPQGELSGLVNPIERLVNAADDLPEVHRQLAELAATFDGMGQSKLADAVRDQLGAITDGILRYEDLRLAMLAIEAQADIMSGAMSGLGAAIEQTGDRAETSAKSIQTAWGKAFKAYSEGQRELDQQRTKAELAWDKERRDVLALVPVVQSATVVYDGLTRQMKLNNREEQIAARTKEILAERLDLQASDARKRAEADIAAQEKLTRAREANAARVAAANARLAESLELEGLRAQHEALSEATIVWDDLAGAFVVVDQRARVVAKALDLLQSGAAGSREEAEAMAEVRINTADAFDRERQSLEKLADARTRIRELDREIGQMREVTAATNRATASWNELTGAWELNDREARILRRTQDELARNTSIGADEARRLATEWVDAADAQKRADESGQKMVDTLNDQADAARRTGDEIQDAFGDMLEAMVFDGEDAFERLMNSWRREGFRAVYDLATTFGRIQLGLPGSEGLSLPTIPSGSIALAGGLASNAIGGTGGLAAGAGGIAGGLINGFSSDFGSRALSWGLRQFPQTSVDIGLATATNVGGTVIATPTGWGSSLAGGINSAGWGTIGSTAMQLLGFEARNPYVGMGLTTAGSIAGGAAGTAIGASIGGTLGAAGGPIGAVIGAAAAQVLASKIGAGASVGPNAAGHLSIDGGRWAIGGVGSDNGGDLSGVTQQLQNAASALNQLMDQLQLTIVDPTQNTWRYGLGSGAASPYSARDAQSLVSQMLGSGLFESADANVQRVLDSAGGSIDPASFQQDLQFAATFSDAIAQWAAASAPAEATTRAAAAEMGALQDRIESFRDTTERLGLDVDTANNVTKQHVETLFGIREAAEPLGPIATWAANAEARLAAAGEMLDELGITAEAAAAGVERAVGRMGDNLLRDIETQLDAATGRSAFGQISQVLTETEAVAKELVAAGKDTSSLYQLRDLRIEEILADQSIELVSSLSSAFGGAVAQLAGEELVARRQDMATALAAQAEEMRTSSGVSAVGAVLQEFSTLQDQAEELGLAMDIGGLQAEALAAAMARLDAGALQDVLRTYVKSQEVQEAATAALANLSTTAELAAEAEAEAARLRMQSIEEAARAAEQAAGAWRQLADTLIDARAGLRLAPSAALSPQLQLAETEAQYQEALQAALSGDREAAAQLPQLAAALQEAGLAWFGPSSEFSALKDTLQADLAEAVGVADGQASIAEQQLDIAEAQLAELRRIANGGDELTSALTDWASLSLAVRTGAAPADAMAQQHSIIDRMDPTALAVALQQAAPGGQAQSYIRQSIANRGLTFDAAADAQARTAFTALSQAVSNGSASGDIRAQQREILSEMGPQGLMWALGLVNPQGAAVGDIRGFLRDFGVPGFAVGGMAGAGLAVVGERGPELVSFPAPAEIIDHGTSRRWIDAAAGIGPGNDRLVSLLERLVDQNAQLLRGSRAGDEASVQLLAEIHGVLRDLAGDSARAAARPRERMPV